MDIAKSRRAPPFLSSLQLSRNELGEGDEDRQEDRRGYESNASIAGESGDSTVEMVSSHGKFAAWAQLASLAPACVPLEKCTGYGAVAV